MKAKKTTTKKPAKKSDGNWIQKAIKKPGSLTKKAKKAGELTKKGDIKDSWIDKVAANKKDKYSKKTEKQAELAKTFRGLRRKK